MPKYHITNYTYKKAKKLGIYVKPSLDKTKKIDVYKKVKGTYKNKKSMYKIASIGANGMNDYPTYIKKMGITYANKRRKLYKIRHKKDRIKKWTPGWLSDQLLW